MKKGKFPQRDVNGDGKLSPKENGDEASKIGNDENLPARSGDSPRRSQEPREAARKRERPQARKGKNKPDLDLSALSEGKVGLVTNRPNAAPGYTLFAPKHRTMTYLLDNQGQVVHEWSKSTYEPGQTVYLLENGNLLRCCFTHARGFTRGGEGGRLEEYDWEDNLVWEFDYASDEHMLHHDIAVMPNGNILALAVERKSKEECINTGFDPPHASR